MRCPEALLAVSGKAGIALEAVILWRRVRMVRRAWHQRPAWRPLIFRMLGRAAAAQPSGEEDGDEHDYMDAPAPAGPAKTLGRKGATVLKRGHLACSFGASCERVAGYGPTDASTSQAKHGPTS